ncbi:SPASM domain-containing protein [Streptomyces sp. NPDC059008]|uniref:SPASM domain-containing protein n=1 Tax=Streptomyces sp. NPDC059008 TaxID=3346693 RepID=UPI0036B2D6B0
MRAGSPGPLPPAHRRRCGPGLLRSHPSGSGEPTCCKGSAPTSPAGSCSTSACGTFVRTESGPSDGQQPTAPPRTSRNSAGAAAGTSWPSPNGDVWPCVFARWMTVGNVHETSLQQIYHGA